MWCIRGGMRPPIHVDGPVQRQHELEVIRLHIPRQRILFLQDACASETPPLMRRRMRPALIFRRSPDGLGGRVRSLASRIIEWNAKIVAQRRVAGSVDL